MEQFNYPNKIEWDEKSYRANYGKLTVEPLERGFGVTLGNSLRRVLLSAIPGVAITSFKISGVAHEFSTIKGVTEDVTDIALNLKQVELKSNISELPKTFLVNIAEKTELVAEDLFPGPEIKVLNPRLHIASLEAGTKLQIELTVNRGFGYVSEERITAESEEKEKKIGTIQLAASFSPVTRVAYHTETARVGQRVDYERLILEIWTTGAIEPKKTVAVARDILKQHLDQVGGKEPAADAAVAAGKKKKSAKEEAMKALGGDVSENDVSLEDLKMPTRICNVLKNAGIETVQALTGLTEAELEAVDGLGEKSLEEVKKFLAKKKLKLKES